MPDLSLVFIGFLAGAAAVAAALWPRLRGARASNVLLQAELDTTRLERGEREREIARMGDLAERRQVEIAAETAELRRRMDELADQLMARRD